MPDLEWKKAGHAPRGAVDVEKRPGAPPASAAPSPVTHRSIQGRLSFKNRAFSSACYVLVQPATHFTDNRPSSISLPVLLFASRIQFTDIPGPPRPNDFPYFPSPGSDIVTPFRHLVKFTTLCRKHLDFPSGGVHSRHARNGRNKSE